jgi:beta-glucanase (GH16 family)
MTRSQSSALKLFLIHCAMSLVPAGARAESDVSPPAAPDGLRWRALADLSDEFDGTALDDSKWLPYLTYWKGRPPSQFEPKNVSVSNGTLKLRSTAMVDSLAEVKDPEKDIWVASACVSSKKPTASFGYYEARIKASRLSMTSSFWFQGKYSEIDVVEQLGDPLKNPDDRNFMLMNTHSFKGGWDKDEATPARWKMPSGAADGFHVYGVWWKDKDTIWFYHDGKKTAEVKTRCEFLEPMFLFFDTEVFTWSGLPGIESLKDPKRNTMEVDWVRSWKLVEGKPK